LKRERTLQLGDKVVIIWTRKHHFVELDGEFQSYVKGVLSDDTPLFKTKFGDFTGETCFWIDAKRVKSSNDVTYFQSLLMPLQVELAYAARKAGQTFHNKIDYKEVKALTEKKKINADKLNHFVNTHGFDPLDDSWIEAQMVTNELERKWFEFTRIHKMPIITEGFVELFNKEYAEKLSRDDALSLTVKKVRYILGAQILRYKGVSNPEELKKAALEFEKKFSKQDERMSEWRKTKKGIRTVKTNKPIEFWAGNCLMKCIEKIPQIFLSPECEYIKPGIELEVIGFDPYEKWIKLDFMPNIREQLGDDAYSIIVHPEDLERLDGIDKL